MSQSFDVVIVGAGIVGAACALECAQVGLRVAIVEAGTVGSGATAAGMGHIVAMDDSDAQFALTRYSQELWLRIKNDLPKDVEFETTGTIWVAADEEEMREVHRKHAYYSSRKVPCEALDTKDLEESEPNLSKGLAGGLLVSEDAVLYPPTAARWLWSRAQGCGARLIERRVGAVEATGIALSDGTSLTAGATVVATGAWATELDSDLEMKKRKGHLAITDRYPGFVRHQLVELGYLKSAHSLASDSVAFNVQPRATGQILIGSSRQYGAEDNDIDRRVIRSMLSRACEYLPGLAAKTVVRCWTGFRAATPDKLPLIGPSTKKPNVWFATGHEGLGITTSLATAKLLVDQILSRTPAIPFEPYLPSRQLREHVCA
jgi:glycine/D-amino acid oxidase-like deaminating enzyme